MSPYGEVWKFTHERLDQAFHDLTDEQLRWRPRPDAHSIAEWIFHLAGSDIWFATRMRGIEPDDWAAKLQRAARAGFIDDSPMPFNDNDATVENLKGALEHSASYLLALLENPSTQQLEMQVETVIGPMVPGVACLWRVAQHAAYHTGQIWVYRFDPSFPA